MLNPIKRIWVPKKPATQAPALEPTAKAPTAPTGPTADTAGNKPLQSPRVPAGRSPLFDELPSPDMEEKNSDSIWAAFESVHAPEIERK